MVICPKARTSLRIVPLAVGMLFAQKMEVDGVEDQLCLGRMKTHQVDVLPCDGVARHHHRMQAAAMLTQPAWQVRNMRLGRDLAAQRAKRRDLMT